MPGIFKKLNASDVKITPFEAHKQYNTTDLVSIGASTSSLAWRGGNKSLFNTSSKKYYQLDKLYYRNYIQERAHRLELNDATYTTQERRLYQSASVLSLSQKTFGSEVQPNSFNLTVKPSNRSEITIKDDGFGNLYDTNLGKDNFPNEDNRVFYLAPINAFKRADLRLDYENGNEYVNSSFPNGFLGDYYDNSYFLNPLTYTNVEFAKSNPFSFIIGQATVGTSIIQETPRNNFYGIKTIKTDTQFIVGQAIVGTSAITNGNETPLTDSLIKINHSPILNFNKDESFTINFFYDPTTQDILNADLGQTDKITFPFTTINTSSLEHNSADGGRRILITNNSGNEFYLAFSGSEYVAPTSATGSATLVKLDLHQFDNESSGSLTATEIAFLIRNNLNAGTITDMVFNEEKSDFDSGTVAFGTSTTLSSAFPFQTDISSSLLSTTASLSSITLATSSTDHYIISKEGTKTVAILPSEGTQHTSLSTTGSSQIGTAPVGPHFPYRIFYRVGELPNSASLHFERSDGDTTQVVSCSFFGGINSNNIARRHVTAMAETDGKLLPEISLEIKGNTTSATQQNSTTQGSAHIAKSCTNQADITIFAQLNPDGTYSNRLNNGAGQISQLMIWNQNLTATELNNVYDSITGTYPIGNLFYDNGFAVITHPKYMDVFDGGNLTKLKYKNTHLITENEYQCTMMENEFEFTRNISARKITTEGNEDIAEFVTGSNFKPYITTIGLYDENANLLMVGKLAQPVRASSETDTTFIIRYDS
tara:strand:- start:1020 stop:3317 length:2298 start_codon:yes stop_codon:yes gene_type:complete